MRTARLLLDNQAVPRVSQVQTRYFRNDTLDLPAYHRKFILGDTKVLIMGGNLASSYFDNVTIRDAGWYTEDSANYEVMVRCPVGCVYDLCSWARDSSRSHSPKKTWGNTVCAYIGAGMV